ncbi:MAG: protein kinase [Deltaproteobacteria bacterium]|nr:protein kinase [Deltaproteobacteria bacterium]MBW2155410.1 protein kinase [Deltaproteobacteria bacterium]MBW2326377.1 protein kinase [Deltaproteobacteria bacterium]
MGRVQKNKKNAVLIIDSDLAGAEKIKSLIVESDYRVYSVGTLKEAHKFMAEKKMDVILLTLRPPYHAPEILITKLQQNKFDPMPPVIVILESFEEEVIAAALKVGAVDFLTFPVDSRELIRRVGVQVRMLSSDSDPIPKRSPDRLLTRLLGGLLPRPRASELLDDRYEKLARLGVGSFGEVWKVRDIKKAPPMIYVAKIPLSKKLNAKIEKEAQILGRLDDHEGIPKVREVIGVEKSKVLIQEFVSGKTLDEMIEREFEAKEVESVVIQLTNVVAYAHELGIIHRDIKPSNVMVRPDGFIKLLDFGAAKELKEKEFSATVTGSRPYMSPEQIMGRSQKRSDVWALGVVMYVLYTGMFPFYHEVEKVLMDMILEYPPSAPSKFNGALDPKIEQIILKCLVKNPENRYLDAGALREEITNSFPGYGAVILPLY